MKKLVFVDSDGTLKNGNGEITEKTIGVLTKLKDKGIEIIITTGRPRYHALKIKNISNASRYVISSNGAEVYDSLLDEVIYCKYMDKATILKVFEIANNNNARCIMTIDDKEVVTDVVKNASQVKLEEDLNTYLDKYNVKQIFVRIDDELLARKTYKEMKEIKELKIVNESIYFQTGLIEEKGIWFSIANKNVNKGRAIKALCKHLNVELKDTYGFGNDYNDIEMFNTVNYSIVMENANKDLQKKAKLIAMSNNEDGVAKFLEELFLKEE